ncbi:Flap endonuclease GEN 1 [Portunus trituberculatus]|uniref:Flap endonuclease GEN 1 n=1 Tax=Portunus trituberculatus TaxID=210409 RepID=A0A5B7KGQ4_PORTR|nr:Flap endonuclease GEN 1 [Portunus trituberculatus]
MGVKGLWEMVSPTGELVCLAGFAGQAVAVDLAGWLVETQSLQLSHVMTRPHLRSVLFCSVFVVCVCVCVTSSFFFYTLWAFHGNLWAEGDTFCGTSYLKAHPLGNRCPE